jgi:polyisoprenoid-binding protein YceI
VGSKSGPAAWSNQVIAKVIVIPLATVFAVSAAAQTTDGVRLELRPGSELSFEGTSTLHTFQCKTTKIEATVQADPAYAAAKLSQLKRPLRTVDIVIPVKSITCGSKGLEDNMYKALKADRFPEIRYDMSTYEVPSATDDGVTLQSVGKLTIAGQQKTISMVIRAGRQGHGNATAVGTQDLLMTDFGIKPPVFMLGTLKTGNKVVVSFRLMATPGGLASAGMTTK